jgi:hypothetical protein
MRNLSAILIVILLFACQDKLAYQIGDKEDMKSAKK